MKKEALPNGTQNLINIIDLKDKEPLKGMNALVLVLDSCRFDTMQEASMPFLKRFAKLEKAISYATYTVAAHPAMFVGNLPYCLNNLPGYNPLLWQPWRRRINPNIDSKANAGMFIDNSATTIIGHYAKTGVAAGVSGVCQFAPGATLQEDYPWSSFTHYGPTTLAPKTKPREPQDLFFNHIDEILNILDAALISARRSSNEGSFLQFINSQLTHYFYDTGEGFPDELKPIIPILAKGLNTRSHLLTRKEQDQLLDHSSTLRQMQIEGLELLDIKLNALFDGVHSLGNGKPTFITITGDHGENFGEKDSNGTPLWGHMHPNKECLEVPMLMGVLE